MTKKDDKESPTLEPSWEYAGWDGPAKARVRRARQLTLRQRLEEMQALIELGERFDEMRKRRDAAQSTRGFVKGIDTTLDDEPDRLP